MAVEDQPGPLSAATLHVLVALASQDLHGYGIIQEVKRLSDDPQRTETLTDDLGGYLVVVSLTKDLR
jgi:hypothetical protein